MIAEPDDFVSLIRRVRSGDDRAVATLVQTYEPLIRREVRLRLDDRRLGRLFDSTDICQSVLASFCLRAAAGQYDLEEPAQLVGLLVAMARNKLASAARLHHRQQRDQRRVLEDPVRLADVPDPHPTPYASTAHRDLLDLVYQQLTAEERRIVEMRGQQRSWEEVAVELGGTPQARRMQLSRALDRACRALGLETE